jgi:bifunctional UDP-N-acetylglucosamine pyrophosphorylase/glucosamine-1-phosphate N-acetyltransferase
MPEPRLPIEIIVLAAGLGTRMKSDLPKVLQPVCGRPMLSILLHELDRVLGDAKGSRFNIVVGHGRERVIELVKGLQGAGRVRAPVSFAVQEEQLGTGHAVRIALANKGASTGLVAVINGDLPLFTADCFAAFVAAHAAAKSAASLLSAVTPDAAEYGRILRKGSAFLGVVEFKDATPAQRKIREWNGGVYLFERALLEKAVGGMKTNNAQGEFYLPDVFAFARKQKRRILAHPVPDASLVAGVNNMRERATAQRALYKRIADRHMAEGVLLEDPDHIAIGPDVHIGRGAVIGPFTRLAGDTVIGEGARVGANCELIDTRVGNGSLVRNGVVAEKCEIGRDCAVGPMAHFRPGTKLADHVRVGNFVEIKESSVGSHTNAAHLSYIGDAEIGSGVNLGCGFITCNYDGTVRDGRRKHRTVVGDNVFVGSDSQLVAPIEIASGTYIASGSTVTDSVPDADSLVIARTRQVTKPGYARKYKKKD